MRRVLNQDFFKRWSPEMTYILGYFAADGTMICNKRGGHFIEFTSTDRVLLVQLKRVTQASQRITIRPKRSESWKPQYRIQIGSKEWFADLEHLGFTPRKSGSLKFPRVPEQYMGDFIRGYFDGDGCVYFRQLQFSSRKKKRPILMTLFTSGSQGFLKVFVQHLRQYGIKGGSLKEKQKGGVVSGYELSFSHYDSLAIYRLMYNTVSITGLFLPRKRKVFIEAFRTLYPNAVVA